MAAACALAGCSVLDGLHGAAPAADVAADGAEIAVLRWVRDAPALELLTPDGTVVRSQALTGEAAASLEAIGPDVAWSPDGRQIAVTGYTGTRRGDQYTYSTSDVFVVTVADGALRRLTAVDDARAPVWTSDGGAIVFTREPPPVRAPDDEETLVATGSLWRVAADGGEPQQLLEAPRGTQLYAGGFDPVDGRRLALTRCRSVPYDGIDAALPCDVVLVPADGRGVQVVVAERAGDPAWSPDGSRLAIIGDRAEDGSVRVGSDETVWQRDVYTVRADGSDLARVTRTRDANEDQPAWAPDGERLAYLAVDGQFARTLMVSDAAGAGTPSSIATEERGQTRLLGVAWRPG